MSSHFYVMEAVNLFCGVDDVKGRHLTLTSLKLPTLQEKYQDHMPGGGPADIEVATGIQKFEAGFNTNGEDAELLRLFGLGARSRQTFTALGAMRSKRTGELVQSKAILEARLGTVAPDDFQRGELRGYEYSLNEILRFELHQGADELFFFDFFENIVRVGGVGVNDDVNRLLRIA
jgi:P2 family phage contractile tail tube protein